MSIEWIKLKTQAPPQDGEYLTYDPIQPGADKFQVDYWEQRGVYGKFDGDTRNTITHWALLEDPEE